MRRLLLLRTSHRAFGLIGAVALTCACAPSTPEWLSLEPVSGRDPRLVGVWESASTGHLVSFAGTGQEVFHVLDDFCVRDRGAVPAYALYRVERDGTRLALQHYDYRALPELLQAPLVFERVGALPDACVHDATGQRLAPADLFAIVTRHFDRFYAFFDERRVDWADRKRAYATRAESLASDAELFDLLAEMLTPLNDGHVNLTWTNRAFNAGRPRLRARLGEAWASSGSELSEGAFVSAWRTAVLDSVDGVLDAGSLGSGAAGALVWGSIADSVGYVRIDRFSGFTTDALSRPAQFDSLDAALTALRADLLGAARLVVDVALNGGGSDAAALLVASYFADQSRPALTYEAAGAPSQRIVVSPRAEPERRPILLVTSEVTASAAESFVLMMRAFPHVTQVGERTRGGLSSLLPKPLPNGFQITLAYQRVLDAAGTLYEGVGIPPAREIELFPDGNLEGAFVRALDALARGS